MTTPVQTPAAGAPAEVVTRKRGRETVGDMVRSLGLVMVGVVVIWWLAQPPSQDEAEIREVPTAGAISELQRAAPGIPVPGELPQGWVSNAVVADGDGLRIGWNTPTEHYVEYAASLGGDEAFLADFSGQGTEVGTFDVAGVTWTQLQNADEETTLVREVDGRTVAVGGTREDTSLEELRQVAAVVRP